MVPQHFTHLVQKIKTKQPDLLLYLTEEVMDVKKWAHTKAANQLPESIYATE